MNYAYALYITETSTWTDNESREWKLFEEEEDLKQFIEDHKEKTKKHNQDPHSSNRVVSYSRWSLEVLLTYPIEHLKDMRLDDFLIISNLITKSTYNLLKKEEDSIKTK